MMVFIGLAIPCSADDADIAESLQDVSVTVLAPGLVGSGTVCEGGYILTCAHVVAGADITGKIANITVYQDTYREGNFVRRRRTTARIYKYSADNDAGLDVAVLKMDQPEIFPTRVHLINRRVARVGTSIYICGSPQGTQNHNSVTRGIVSFTGRFINNRIHDQTDAAMFQGTSGGGVYTLSGEYIGMLSRGNGSGIGYFLPKRVIVKYLKEQGLSRICD